MLIGVRRLSKELHTLVEGARLRSPRELMVTYLASLRITMRGIEGWRVV